MILDDPPAYDLVRVIVRGTGPTPVFGARPRVPLAGLVGGPAGGEDDGHDAVLTLRTGRAAHGHADTDDGGDDGDDYAEVREDADEAAEYAQAGDEHVLEDRGDAP